jgi:hypothetical protein
MEIQMGAIPLLVEGQVNPAVPSKPGVYVLLHDHDIRYVGKAAILRNRLQGAYQKDPQFTHVWWQTLEAAWCATFEARYICQLKPLLNGHYHHDRFWWEKNALLAGDEYSNVPVILRGIWGPELPEPPPFDDNAA